MKWLTILGMLILCTTVQAQRSISGTITDANGEALIGVKHSGRRYD